VRYWVVRYEITYNQKVSVARVGRYEIIFNLKFSVVDFYAISKKM